MDIMYIKTFNTRIIPYIAFEAIYLDIKLKILTLYLDYP